MHSSTSPGAKGFTTIAKRHRSKAPTETQGDLPWNGRNAHRAARVRSVMDDQCQNYNRNKQSMPRVTPRRRRAYLEDIAKSQELRRRELNPGLPRDRRNY